MPDSEAIRRLLTLLDEPSADQRSAWPRQTEVNVPGAEHIHIPSPPQFQPRPYGVGQDTNQALDALINFAPSLQPMIRKVEMGPNEAVMESINHNRPGDRVIRESNPRIVEEGRQPWKPWDFMRLNLLGITNPFSGDITLNPRLRTDGNAEYSVPSVLAHEATHAAGYAPEAKPEEARNLINKMGLEGLKRVPKSTPRMLGIDNSPGKQ